MASSEVRAPSALVFSNGVKVPGLLDVEIGQNSFLAANRYRARFSLSASGYGIWSGDDIELDIRFQLGGAETSMIVGPVDRVAVDPARGEVLVEGRDLTAGFIEARTQENFENQTSSGIATILAARQGLVPAVTPTSTLVGRNFQNDHAQTTLDQHARVTTEWDLLTRLAEHEGFDVWVQGRVLYFAPALAVEPALIVTPQNCLSMRLERTLSLSSNVSVAVKSWDCRGAQAIVQTANGGDGGTANYVMVRPNMTADAAQSLAQRIFVQMSQQARCIEIEMPGDLTTLPRAALAVAGTGTDFDGVYVVASVERRLSFEHGFTQTLEARVPPWTVF